MKRIDEVKLNEVYKYICYCHEREGRSPTYREIATACDINSTGWVSSLIQVLEERGQIELEKQGNRRKTKSFAFDFDRLGNGCYRLGMGNGTSGYKENMDKLDDFSQ